MINRVRYKRLSVLSRRCGDICSSSFEDCDKETYKRMLELVKNVDLDLITEVTDETDLMVRKSPAADPVKYSRR